MEPEKVESPEPKALEVKWWWFLILGILAILIAIGLLRIFNPTPITNPVSPLATPIANPANPLTTPIANQSQKDVVMDYGIFGSYKSEYDANIGKYVVGQWEGSRIRAGLNLADMKTDSSSVSFVLPFEAEINNSGGNFFVNGTQWKLGNPVEDSTGNTIIPAGSTITISYESGNDSAGWMIIFQ